MLDAIIIADTGLDTYSVSSSFRLQVDGRPAVIQNICNYIENNGKIVNPVVGEDKHHWHCAPKLNGIALMSHLITDGFNVELIDSYYKERNRFIEHLRDNPRAIIISTTFILNKRMLAALVDDIRQLAGDICIIAGGPFVYSSYLLLKRGKDRDYDTTSPAGDFLFLNSDDRPDVDLFIIDGRGEWILSSVLNRIRDGKDKFGLPNLARWEHGEYVFSPRHEYHGRQRSVMIDWEMIPARFFASGVMNVQASRGCPFQCEFCNFVKDENDTHLKPIPDLVSELSDLARRGVKYIRFVDDNFRLGKNDLNEVCRAFVHADIDIQWMSFIRASTLANTDLNLLKRAGCIDVQMGVESADQTVLQNMNKRADPDMYLRVIREVLTAGINCSCCFLVGFPGETEASFQKTIDFINDISGHNQSGQFFWSIYSFLLAPLSPVYEASKREVYNLSGYMDRWKHFSMDSDTARSLIRKAFNEIKHSGPIYSGDNLEMLAALSPEQKRRFFNLRHSFEKRIAEASQDRGLVIDSFLNVLSPVLFDRDPVCDA